MTYEGFTNDNNIIPIDAFPYFFYAFQKRRLRTKIYECTNSDVISYLAKDYKRGLNSRWLSTQSLIATDFQIYKWNKFVVCIS